MAQLGQMAQSEMGRMGLEPMAVGRTVLSEKELAGEPG